MSASSPIRSSCRCSCAPACCALGVARDPRRCSATRSPSCSRACKGRRKYAADAGLRDPAADELHHQDLCDPQPSSAATASSTASALLGIIDQPLDLPHLQPQGRDADAGGDPAALRDPADLHRAGEDPAQHAARRRPISAPSAWQTFRGVILPLSLQGRCVGASFTFVLAFGDFVTPQMVGGHERLHLRPHHLQPVRPGLQLAVRCRALGHVADRRAGGHRLAAAHRSRPREQS